MLLKNQIIQNKCIHVLCEWIETFKVLPLTLIKSLNINLKYSCLNNLWICWQGDYCALQRITDFPPQLFLYVRLANVFFWIQDQRMEAPNDCQSKAKTPAALWKNTWE